MTPFRRSDDLAERPSVAGADFGSTEGGLFSAQDVRRLMRIEFERAQRYKYPLACFLIAVDRLERLHDLYGIETKETILQSLGELLRAETRASDLLGVLVDDRLLVMIPHAPRGGSDALAKRLLEGARKLKFQSDGRNVRITLARFFTPRGQPYQGVGVAPHILESINPQRVAIEQARHALMMRP